MVSQSHAFLKIRKRLYGSKGVTAPIHIFLRDSGVGGFPLEMGSQERCYSLSFRDSYSAKTESSGVKDGTLNPF